MTTRGTLEVLDNDDQGKGIRYRLLSRYWTEGLIKESHCRSGRAAYPLDGQRLACFGHAGNVRNRKSLFAVGRELNASFSLEVYIQRRSAHLSTEHAFPGASLSFWLTTGRAAQTGGVRSLQTVTTR